MSPVDDVNPILAAMRFDENRHVPALQAEIEQLRADAAEYRQTFDLQWTRMADATRQWREESPKERALIQPDLGDLLAWLLDREDAGRVVVEQLRVERDECRAEIAELRERIADLVSEIERLRAGGDP